MEARVSVLEEKVKVANNRIEDLEHKTDKLEDLTLSVQRIGLSCESIAKEQTRLISEIETSRKKDEEFRNSIEGRIVSVEQQPIVKKAKFHDRVVEQVFGLIVTALVGFLLGYFFNL